MLATILTILKIIGIVLLVLLGLALLIVCLVLFVPIRYRAEGTYYGNYSVTGAATWLLRLLSVRVCLGSEQPFRILVRLIGIPVYDTARPRRERKTGSAARKQKSGEPVPSEAAERQPYEAGQEPLAQPQLRSAEITSDIPESDNTEDSLSFFYKLQTIFHKIIQFLQNFQYTIGKIYDKIVNIKSNIQYYADVLAQEETVAAWAAAKHQLLCIWHNVQPRRWRVYAHIGTGDPAAVGDILGVWGALYPLHEGRVELEPDFDRCVAEGEFCLRGHITLFVFLRAAFIYFFDKDIKHLRKCLLREEK